MKISVLTALFVILPGIMPCGYAEIPDTINFQGYLSDPSGNPVEGATDIRFSIPGTLWVEEHTGVLVKQGVFSVQLGSQMPLAGVDFSQGPGWLEIEVNGTSQTVPLSSVPYAFHAKTVEQGNVESGILDYGEMEGVSTLTKTITLSEDGIIILSGYAQAWSNYSDYGSGNAETSVWIRIDGAGCSADLSIENKSNLTFRSAASCIKELLAGSHTIEVENDTEYASAEHTRMSWVVFGKKRDTRSGSNNNVGINTASPQDKLEVAAIIREHNVSLSDQRLKQNIQTLENALAKLVQLRGVSFEWKNKAQDAGIQVGLIAQEVENVLPEVVSTDSEGYKSIAYGKLVAVLVEAAKEQQRLIDQKSATIAEQQEKIATLEAMMQRMNRQMAALNQTVDALKAAVQLIPPQQQPQAVHTRHH